MTAGPRMPAPGISHTAYALGFAGLLPQAAAVVLMVLGRSGYPFAHAVGLLIASVYAASILSFLGGIWWGVAMRREQGQGAAVALAVLPSLVAVALLCWAGAESALVSSTAAIEGGHLRAPLLALGLAIVLTLLVDHRLIAAGDVPRDWMRLRAPLSLGLGGFTVLAGLLAG